MPVNCTGDELPSMAGDEGTGAAAPEGNDASNLRFSLMRDVCGLGIGSVDVAGAGGNALCNDPPAE